MTDSSAVLLKNGNIIVAVEEERFTRVKHQRGFPRYSIDFILKKEKISIEDIDSVAVYWNPYDLKGRLYYILSLLVNINLFFSKVKRSINVFFGSKGKEKDGWLDLFFLNTTFKKYYGKKPNKINFYDHHLCHIASSYFISGYHSSAVLVMDGAGEYACTTLAKVINGKIEIIEKINLPNSLGHFYSAVTGYLGFKMLEDEYKVMGLSSYGEPIYYDWLKKNYLILINSKYYLNSKCLDYHKALNGDFSGEIEKNFGKSRNKNEQIKKFHKDFAASAQKIFEDISLKLVKVLKNKTDLSNLCIVGGCALNCTANGVISESRIFNNVFIPPSPHDAGAALGAALLYYKKNVDHKLNNINYSPYTGPSYENSSVVEILKIKKLNYTIYDDLEKFFSIASDSIIKDRVICWFQGRSEFGPRALGNRSFIADPRDKSIVETMNIKIKKREEFRPFAPSVKIDNFKEYFDNHNVNEYMTLISKVKKNKIQTIPAVVHVDNTSRPQIVDKDKNPTFWHLIDNFHKKTGIPMVLNTSYNIQEPIVNSPEEAINTFLNSNVDKLFINNIVVSK